MERATSVELLVNGTRYEVDVDATAALLGVLREELDLTGTKYGCGEAQCGMCTVLIDDVPVRSCVTPVGSAVGREVTTIEGLERDGRLHPVQKAFLREDALQCGFCTPGMIMSAVGLLKQHASPSAQQIVSFMDGNVCRCGAYPRIVAAIRRAAETAREG